MPTTRTITVYDFDDLSDKAKARARDWYRDAQGHDLSWADQVLEDAQEMGKVLGITITPDTWAWAIDTQGAGANFAGRWARQEDAPQAIREAASQDAVLHGIADALAAAGVDALTIRQSGRACHEYATTIDHEPESELDEAPIGQVEAGRLALHQFMRWVHDQLDQHWNYMQSDEYVDESIRANEYRFAENGKRTITL